MKKKIWRSLVICLVTLLVGVAGIVSALALKNKTAVNQSDVVSGAMTAGDAETLRALLLATGECSITLTEDVTVTEQLLVNGTKTLLGNKSIIMDTSNIGTDQSVCSVKDNATLILDGVTIDGNGVSNGIAVKIGGKLTCLSGDIVYGYPYGLTIAGAAEIADVTIYNAMHTGIYVEYGGKATMSGGTVYKNVYGVVVASGADMSIGENAVIKNSNEQLVANYGTLEIIGGEYHDSYGHGILSKGELEIAGSANKKIEIYNVGGAAINANNNSKLTASNLYIHDVGTHAFCIERKTEADVQDCVIEKTGKSSVYISGSTLVMEDVTVSDVTSYAIYATKKSNTEIKDIVVKNAGSRGITNDGSNLTAKNIVVRETKQNGIHTMGDGAVTSLENIEIIKTGTNAMAVTEGIVSGKNVTIEEPAYEGLYLAVGTKIELENVTINKSGMTSVANNGGTLAVRKIKIIDSANMGIKTTDAGTVAVTNGIIMNSASHALAIENGSIATIKECKIEEAGNEKVKAAVYVSASKMNMYDSQINNCASYGIYVTDSKKAVEKQVALQNITVTNVGTDAKAHRGIANVGSWITVTNAKVLNTAGAGIYTQGKDSITNLNEVTVTNAGTCGLGFTGGEATARNVTIMTPKNEGIYVGKGVNVWHLDNAMVTNPGTHGIGNYGGTIHVTVDKAYNPDNKSDNGVTITNPGESGILSRSGVITVKNATIKNAGKHAVCIEQDCEATLNGCKIDKTAKSAVYVSKSILTMKNAQIKNSESYGVYVTDSAKTDGKVAILDNITVTKPGITNEHRGIANINSYVVVTNTTVTESAGAGIYTNGVAAVTNMNEIVVSNAGTCGLGLTGGEVTARNVTINTPKNEGVYVSAGVNVKNLDDVTITEPGLEGIGNYGGTIHITVNKTFNPENDNNNGVTIIGAKGCGIWNKEGGSITGRNVTIDSVGKYGILIEKGTTVTLNNAKINNITGADREGINCSGTLVVTASNDEDNGVKITNVTNGHGIFVDTDGIVKADKVSINGASRKGLYVCGSANVTANLTISNTGEHGVQVGSGAKATISGFEIKNTNSAGKTSAAVYALENAELTMINGTVAGVPTHGVYVEKANVTLTDATITKLGSEGVYNSGGTVTINGGTITEAAGCGIWNKDGGTVTGSNFEIDTVAKYGIYIEAGTTANLDNATLNNINGGTTERSGIQCVGTLNITANNETKNGVTITNVENGHGIFVKNGKIAADKVTIQNSSKCGLFMEGGTDHYVTDIKVSNIGMQGLQFAGGAIATINGFYVSDTNKTGSATAIYINGTSNVMLKNGAVSATVSGIYLDGSSQVIATNVKLERKTGNVSTLVVVKPGCTFTLSEIDGGTSYVDGKGFEGRGVEVKGIFNLNGGTICNNKVTSQAGAFNTDKPKDGAGVYVLDGGNFTMNGGIISGNSADCGGGVSVYGEGASFTFEGGTIQGNTTRAGAGVINRKGTFLMNGGTITSNHATENGAGVCLISGQNMTMNGGLISDNIADNKGGAIYGYGNNTITLNTGKISGNTALQDNLGNGIHSGANTVRIIIGAGFEMIDNYK